MREQHHRHGLRVFVLQVGGEHRLVDVGQLVPDGAADRAADLLHDRLGPVGVEDPQQQLLGRLEAARRRRRCRTGCSLELEQQLLDHRRVDPAEHRHGLGDLHHLLVVQQRRTAWRRPASLSASIMIEAFSAPVQPIVATIASLMAPARPAGPCSQPRTTRTASSGLASIALRDLTQQRRLDRAAHILEVDQLRPAACCQRHVLARPAPSASSTASARRPPDCRRDRRRSWRRWRRARAAACRPRPGPPRSQPGAGTGVTTAADAEDRPYAKEQDDQGQQAEHAELDDTGSDRSGEHRPSQPRSAARAAVSEPCELPAHDLDHVATALVDSGGAAHQGASCVQLLGSARLVGIWSRQAASR